MYSFAGYFPPGKILEGDFGPGKSPPGEKPFGPEEKILRGGKSLPRNLEKGSEKNPEKKAKMSAIFAGLIFLVMVIILIIIGYFAANGATKLYNHKGYHKDKDFQAAHEYLTYAAVIAWLTIGFLLLLAILAVVGAVMTFGGEIEVGAVLLASPAARIFAYLFMFIAILLVFICGFYCIRAAISMHKSADFKDSGDLKTAYYDAIYASLASMITLGILLILVVFTIWYRRQAVIGAAKTHYVKHYDPKTVQAKAGKVKAVTGGTDIGSFQRAQQLLSDPKLQEYITMLS